jgi:hypothetical protein
MSSDQEKQSIRNHCCNRLKVGDQLQRKEVQESRWVEFLQNEGQELLWVLLVVHGLLALATTLMASTYRRSHNCRTFFAEPSWRHQGEVFRSLCEGNDTSWRG